jgi:predicted GH43/DUF377 family glycosyl hydrolase
MKKSLLQYGIFTACLLLSSCGKDKQEKGYQNVRLCERLSACPSSKDQMVLSVKKIDLVDAKYPYNASLERCDNGFLLFFREDVLLAPIEKNVKMQYHTKVKVSKLDSCFNQLGSSCILNTGSEFSEDPRVIKKGKDFCLIFNDIEQRESQRRIMRCAYIDGKDLKIKKIADLDLGVKPIEKNWTPFVDHHQDLCFIYSINPSLFFSFHDVLKGKAQEYIASSPQVSLKNLWDPQWGAIRGGTPARLVDQQYLAFFHSSFKERGKIWYVMGAYTFEAKPPYKVTAISKYPILFDGIYNTKAENTAKKGLRCIFPAGFVEGFENEEVFYLSCGENDCATKIITISKRNLLSSLKKIN